MNKLFKILKLINLDGSLTILLIVLKLNGYITWSWIWVASPLWISFFISIIVSTIIMIINTNKK